MKCPHCLESFFIAGRVNNAISSASNLQILFYIGADVDGNWWLEKTTCPACTRYILVLILSEGSVQTSLGISEPSGFGHKQPVHPKSSNRPPIPSEVPEEYAADYREACLVIADSPKASAALSRRCLQHLLRDKMQISGNTLNQEIEKAIEQANLPSSVTDLLHPLRELGNTAAHPINHLTTGEILDIEPWEAEFCLEVIEGLYDFLFVAPARTAERLKRLDQKTQP